MASKSPPDPIQKRCQQQFNKVFKFNVNESECQLPSVTTWFQSESVQDQHSDFTKLKQELNQVKGQLDKLPLKEWHDHTRRQNPAGSVLGHVRRVAAPELLTQAWCKFIEILDKLQPLPKANLRSVHLCEAPGAFVSALNHHIQLHQPGLTWTWRASSLNPYFEGNPTSCMVNDDRFIVHTLDSWIFGSDQTGDILDKANRLDLTAKLATEMKGKVDLVTADGSIDCQMDPASQENIVSPLHVAETAIALRCVTVIVNVSVKYVIFAFSLLAKGGSFVLKMFTLFEHNSGCLMLLLVHAFDHVTVFKPATSKEGNSECYVVAKGFKSNLDQGQMESLMSCCHQENLVMLPKDTFSSSFKQQLLECAKFFKTIQSQVIQRNLDTFNNDTEKTDNLEELRQLMAEEFEIRFKLSPIDSEAKLCSNLTGLSFNGLNLDKRIEYLTFEDMVTSETKVLTKSEQGQRLLAEVLAVNVHWIEFRLIEWFRFPSSASSVINNLDLVYSKPFTHIVSSKFCSSRVLATTAKAFRLFETEVMPKAIKKRRKTESQLIQKLISLYPNYKESIETSDFAATNLRIHHSRLTKDLTSLVEQLKTLQMGHNLFLNEFVCLTQLDVGILTLLGQCFHKVGFVRPRGHETGILLASFKGRLPLLEEVVEAMKQESLSKQLWRVLPLSTVLRHNRFYSLIVAHNVLTLKEKAAFLLSQVQPQQ